MPLEIKVGPPQLAIHQGFTVFITEPDGSVAWPTDKGLYFNDTRLISAYAIYANGAPWDLLNSGAPVYYGCRIFMTNRTFPSEGGEVLARTLSLVLSRTVEGGLHEGHEITNHARVPVVFNYEISIRSDFVDVFEVKSGRIIRRGRVVSTWAEASGALCTSYSNGVFRRAVQITASGDSPAAYANGRLTYSVHLDPGATWKGQLEYNFIDGDRVLAAPTATCKMDGASPQAQELAAWSAGVLKLTSSVHSFERLFDQAVEDMAALRLPVQQQD